MDMRPINLSIRNIDSSSVNNATRPDGEVGVLAKDSLVRGCSMHGWLGGGMRGSRCEAGGGQGPRPLTRALCGA